MSALSQGSRSALFSIFSAVSNCSAAASVCIHISMRSLRPAIRTTELVSDELTQLVFSGRFRPRMESASSIPWPIMPRAMGAELLLLSSLESSTFEKTAYFLKVSSIFSAMPAAHCMIMFSPTSTSRKSAMTRPLRLHSTPVKLRSAESSSVLQLSWPCKKLILSAPLMRMNSWVLSE